MEVLLQQHSNGEVIGTNVGEELRLVLLEKQGKTNGSLQSYEETTGKVLCFTWCGTPGGKASQKKCNFNITCEPSESHIGGPRMLVQLCKSLGKCEFEVLK